MALVTLTGPNGTSLRTPSHRVLTDKSLFAEIEKGDRVARGADGEGFNRAYLTRIGREWVEVLSRDKERLLRQPDGSEPMPEHYAQLGFKLEMWNWSNSLPSPILRVWPDRNKPPIIVSLDTPTLALDGTPVEDSEEIAKRRQEYQDAVKRFNQDRFDALISYATTGSPEEQGLGLVLTRRSVPTEDVDVFQERDKTFAKVRGKHLPDYEARPAPEGMEWQLVRQKAKPRGRAFLKGYDPRRWVGGNSS